MSSYGSVSPERNAFAPKQKRNEDRLNQDELAMLHGTHARSESPKKRRRNYEQQPNKKVGDPMKELLAFKPVTVDTSTTNVEDGEIKERPVADIWSEKGTKSMSHFLALAKLTEVDVDQSLLLLVVQRCISKGLPSTRILASATEQEFREIFQDNDGANPDLRYPGEGRSLALQLHKSACVVQQAVTEANEASIRGMSERTNAQECQRGRKREKETDVLEKLACRMEDRRKRRKDRKALDRASSSSSSESSFDVPSLLERRNILGFPQWALPERSVLKKLNRQSRRRSSKYIAERSFEEWVPAHVGRGLPEAERKEELKRWRKECTNDVPKALESIQCFWLSHALVSECIPACAVQAHMAVLSRMHSQYDLSYVIQYERYLHVEALELTANKEKIDFTKFLGTENPAVLQRMTATYLRSLRNQPNQPQQRASMQASRYEEPIRSVPIPEPAVEEREPRSDGRKEHVCFAHDLANGSKCPNASNGKCSYVHLDTRKGDDAKRLSSAKKAVEQVRQRKAQRETRT